MPIVKSVTSRDNPLLVRLRKLAGDPSAYRKTGEIWLEGEHLCASFVHAGAPVTQAVITEAAWEEPRSRQLASCAQAVAVISPSLMESLSALESAPPLGFVVPWPGPGSATPHLDSVVLDRLQDPGNVGTIVRTAAAFGFTQVIALKGTAALWAPKALRAGMGAHFSMRLVESASHAELSSLGVPLVATSSHAAMALSDFQLPSPCAWVLGHEGQGIDADLLRRCAATVSIPQPGGEESLNVASAAAVCLYESVRQRS